MFLILIFSISYIPPLYSVFIHFSKNPGGRQTPAPTFAVAPNVRAKFLLRWISWQTRDTCNLSPHTTLWNSIQSIHWYLWRHAFRLSFSFMAFSNTIQIKYKFPLGRHVLTVYSWNLTSAVDLFRTRLLIRLKFGEILGKRATMSEHMP